MNDSAELQKLIDICHQNLKNTYDAKKYIIGERGISKEMCLKYKLGFFPRNISKLCQYVSREFLEKAGLIDYDGLSEYSDHYPVVFPIYDEYGIPVGLSCRSLLSDDERRVLGIPKYKNTRYKKTMYLFGFNLAREHILLNQDVFVVEGNFDQVSMFSAGIKNTVASCGTAFGKTHLIKLSRYTDKITILFDGDDAGIKSSMKIYEKFVNNGLKLRFAKLPKIYKDPGDYFKTDVSGVSRTSSDFYKDLTYINTMEWA